VNWEDNGRCGDELNIQGSVSEGGEMGMFEGCKSWKRFLLKAFELESFHEQKWIVLIVIHSDLHSNEF
jgi:hypothetical protein